ncbi:MAG TPA: FAD:protein FMN transferase, partial [Candidatus Limnocylindrales bacterium]|nr:FAD:protein FMN transferase [Candidatus Limnocylindrales bacterium]
MDTVVSIEVVPGSGPPSCDVAVERAFAWFEAVERSCTRFDESGEVIRLARVPDRPVAVSPILFEAVRFALRVAARTGGAFDPTVGSTMAARGFSRAYRTGRPVAPLPSADGHASYRDVVVNEDDRTLTLRRPLVLDLGAVAKGLAIDLAAVALQDYASFLIEAGGDLFVRGANPQGQDWQIAIQDPFHPQAANLVVAVSDRAVCTSGGYARRLKTPGEHHLLDPRTVRSPKALASVTAIAGSAMLADALSTAAFVLG